MYRVPPRLPPEATTSWLMRVALEHGCGYAVLRRTLALGKQDDPDFSWPWSADSTASFLNQSIDAISAMLGWRTSRASRVVDRVVMGTAEVPRFRLCVACAMAAGRVYFRVECRFSFVTLCPEHGTPMTEPTSELAIPAHANVDPGLGAAGRRRQFERRICRQLRAHVAA